MERSHVKRGVHVEIEGFADSRSGMAQGMARMSKKGYNEGDENKRQHQEESVKMSRKVGRVTTSANVR